MASPFDQYGDFKRREADLHFFDAGEIPAAEDDDVRTIYSESLATLVSGLDDDAMSTITEGKKSINIMI